MSVFGISIVLMLGFINLGLLLFQLLTGLRYIKVGYGVHKKTGIVFFACALVHGILGFLISL
jgi:hypothetical protein